MNLSCEVEKRSTPASLNEGHISLFKEILQSPLIWDTPFPSQLGTG